MVTLSFVLSGIILVLLCLVGYLVDTADEKNQCALQAYKERDETYEKFFIEERANQLLAEKLSHELARFKLLKGKCERLTANALQLEADRMFMLKKLYEIIELEGANQAHTIATEALNQVRAVQ